MTGRVQMTFTSSGGSSTKLTDTIAGTAACADGSTGRVISGTFEVRQTSGTFSVNSCPAVQ
jgi:hypothetical protein